MTFAKERKVLEQAISGFGVDEQSVLEIFKGAKIEDVRCFGSGTPATIIVDGVRRYKTIAHYDVERMQSSFLHFHKALEMWTKHPYVRDACLMRSAFQGGEVLNTNILIEVICTRTPVRLYGARFLYQRMYETTIEDQLGAYTPQTTEHKLLSTMLYMDMRSNEQEMIYYDVKILFQTSRRGAKNKAMEIINNETIYYIDMMLRQQDERVNNTSFKGNVDKYKIIKLIMKCRRDPVLYFLDVLDDAFKTNDVDALTHVIVTRANDDMREIKKAYFARHNISLQQKIEDVAKGCYKDFILMLMAYSRDD